ncbi:MAG: GntP family permease, partial [Cyclobacteriaceae bacterium]|nr:GntP family permease [Cyclobacteriaceae bacterium]
MVVLYLLLSVILIILLTTKLKVHPFLALFAVALMYGFLSGMSLDNIIDSINTGFGETLGKIGLIIIFGVIIGAFLENSGGAYRLAEAILKIVGKKRVPTAMGVIGYFISIPVFADSGFILLSPLNKSLTKKAGITLAGSTIALAMGLMATHTLVPPTPGPIAAAGILNADLGLVMLIGVPVSAFALIVAI